MAGASCWVGATTRRGGGWGGGGAARAAGVGRAAARGRGLWGLPGGYVDWNEHPEAALVRECTEEMQVTVEPIELLPVQHIVVDDEGIVFLPYRARLVGGEPAAGDEVQEVGWFKANGLPPVAFPSHRQVLKRWAQDVATRGVA